MASALSRLFLIPSQFYILSRVLQADPLRGSAFHLCPDLKSPRFSRLSRLATCY